MHLYIHWPFCHSKCHFCDFVAFAAHEEFQQEYHQKLCQEIKYYAQSLSVNAKIKTIFIGGGTPSLYPLPLLRELFGVIQQNFDCSALQEVTIESNPADINPGRLACWRELGINRLSIGIQCLDDDVLQKMNRWQRVTDVQKALEYAPQFFSNISIDLIMGLPGISHEAWIDTVQKVVQWPIVHISVYFLMIQEKTPLYFALQKGSITLDNDDQAMVDMYAQTVTLLARCGFEQYEISNFAKRGYASMHNIAYWNRRPYRGFGIGASSFDGRVRSTNCNNLKQYLSCCNGDVPCAEDVLNKEQAFLELLMLGLRQKEGIDLRDMVYFVDSRKMQNIQENIEDMVRAGLLERQQTKIRLTVKGMALENEIIVRLFSP